MAISLPQRFLRQPQHAAPLDPSHPLFKDIAFAYSAGRGLVDGKHPEKFGSFAGTMLSGYGGKGKHIRTGAAGSHLAFPSIDDYNILGDVTTVALIRHASTTSQGVIIHKCESSGGTNTPFGLLIESSGAISFNRSNTAGSRPFRVWASAATLSVNQSVVVAATQTADMSVPAKFYIDGSFDAGAAANLYEGAGAGAPTPTPVSLKLGNRTDNLSRFNGEIYDVVVLKRVLSGSEIADLSRKIWAIWQAPARRIWFIGVETNNLAVTNPEQGNSSGIVNIAQAHALVAAASAQANLSSVGAMTASMVVSLTGLEISHRHYADAAGVIQNHGLPSASAAQNNISSAGSISQKHVVAAAGTMQENTSSDVSIGRGLGGIEPQTATQANTSGAAFITQAHVLASTTAGQANSASNAALGGEGVIEPALIARPVSTAAVKKPGIPAGTPGWLKTTLEILTGRRGNRMEAPKLQALTFSAIPTKAECEALYHYINTVRHSLEQIIRRLDS